MIKINLIPAEIIEKRNNKWKKMIPYIFLWLILVAGFGIEAGNIRKIHLLEQKLFEINSHLKANQELMPKLKDWKTQKQLLEKTRAVQTSILAEKIPPNFLLERFTIMLPQDMWFTNINLQGKNLELRGNTLSYKSLAVFLNNLNTCKYFVKDPVLLESSIINFDEANEEIMTKPDKTRPVAISFIIKGILTDEEVSTVESQISVKSQIK